MGKAAKSTEKVEEAETAEAKKKSVVLQRQADKASMKQKKDEKKADKDGKAAEKQREGVAEKKAVAKGLGDTQADKVEKEKLKEDVAKAKEEITKIEAKKLAENKDAKKLAEKVVQKQEAVKAEDAKAGKDADCDKTALSGEKAAEQIKLAKKQADDSQKDITAKIDQLSVKLKMCKDVSCMEVILKEKNELEDQLKQIKQNLPDQVKKVAKDTKASPEVEKKMVKQANGEI